MAIQTVFRRYEKKYLLNETQFEVLFDVLAKRMVPDAYGETKICNLYFDTDDHRLIRRSLDRPVYKEKLRLRSYGVPNQNDNVFIEIKKKYKGIVYKRRVCMALDTAHDYLFEGKHPDHQSQIIAELDWFLQLYPNLSPAMYIAYDRTALYDTENPDLRITFDRNIVYREQDLQLQDGMWGTELLQSDQILMEIKIPGAMPMWLSHLLDNLHIFPTSFSKYGKAYLTTQIPSA